MTRLDPQVALTAERFAAYRQPKVLSDAWIREGLQDHSVVGPRLLSRLAQFPDRTAVIDRNTRITNGELLQRANSLAAYFFSVGIGPGHVVAWQTPNWWEATVVALATWQVGAINNPIVMIYREHELREILGELRPSAIVAPAAFRNTRHQELLDSVLQEIGHDPLVRLGVRGGNSRWLNMADIMLRKSGRVTPPAVATALDPCVVAFTSGTTSGAKGVVLDSAGLLAETRQMRETWGVSWRDTAFMPAPLAHLTGLIVGFTVPVTAGSAVVFQDKWDPEEAVEIIEAECCVISSGAPTFLTDLTAAYEESRFSHSSLSQYSVGGSAVAPELIDRADSLGIAAFRCYGMTEHLSTTIANRGSILSIRRDTDGPVGPGSEVTVVDENGLQLAQGQEGELRVRGPERMMGYVRVEHNTGVLDAVEGWFMTGDIGFVDSENCVHVTGRRKDIINRGGEKFSAREIEDVITRHPAFHQSAVVPKPDDRMGEVPAVFVVLAGGQEMSDPEVLNAYLLEHGLAKQKLPTEWHVIAEMPVTPFGKIRKNELIDLLRNQASSL